MCFLFTNVKQNTHSPQIAPCCAFYKRPWCEVMFKQPNDLQEETFFWEKESWREKDFIHSDICNELPMLIKVRALTDWGIFGLMLPWCQNIDLKVFIIIISKYACIKRGHMSCHWHFEGKQMHAGLEQSRYLKQTFVV